MVHAYLDGLYFKKVYWKVHKRMDSAWLICRRGHRRYWHDWISEQVIAAESYPGDEEAFHATLLHIQTDQLCTAYPNYRKLLEICAKADAKKRRHSKKGASST